MMTHITWNGVRSDSMGVRITKLPPLVRAPERVKVEEIPGRQGVLTIAEGQVPVFDKYNLDIEGVVLPNANMDNVLNWLTGAGNLIRSDYPDRAYRAHIIEAVAYEKIQGQRQHRRFEATFSCQPFRYQATPEVLERQVGGMIPNPGNVYSEPIITIYGSGDINLLVGTSAVLITGLDTGSITLNCEAKIAYRPTDLTIPMNKYVSLVGDEWPRFDVGTVMLQWTGAVSKVVIEPQWRWR